jgi:hypothetical protein
MPYLHQVIDEVTKMKTNWINDTTVVASTMNSRARDLASSTPTEGESRDLQRRIQAADQVFFDKKKDYGDVPVGRQLTFQEVVITFFLFSIAFFGIAITTHQFITTQSILSALKVLGTYILLTLIMISFIVRYA